LALATLGAMTPVRGEACGSCTSPDEAFPPIGTAYCVSVSGTTSASCPALTYTVDLVTGERHAFTTQSACSAFAEFDAVISLFDPACNLVGTTRGQVGRPALDVTATVAGPHVLEVTGATPDDFGPFRIDATGHCSPQGFRIEPVAVRPTDGCSREIDLTFTTVGFGPFTWDWTITPIDPGTSATPSGARVETITSSVTQSCTIGGPGRYHVSAGVLNACFVASREATITLEDIDGPRITTSASPGDCPVRMAATAPGSSPSDRWRAPTDPPEPPATAAPMSHLPTCATGVLANTENPFYDVFVSCADGAFTARTGALHPVTLARGAAQGLLAGGADGTPATSRPFLRFNDRGFPEDLDDGTAHAFDPPDTPQEPASTGITVEWLRPGSYGPFVRCREEIVAFGTEPANAGIRITMSVSLATAAEFTRRCAIQWLLDHDAPGDAGPALVPFECDPPRAGPELTREHELGPSERGDVLALSANGPAAPYVVLTSAGRVEGRADARRPDRVVYGALDNLLGVDWDYTPTEGDAAADMDSAVLLNYGTSRADGISIDGGQTVSRSIVMFAASGLEGCGVLDPGGDTQVQACPYACVTVGSGADDECAVTAFDLVETSVGAPPCVGNPCLVELNGEGTHTYTWEAVDGEGNRRRSTVTVIGVDGPGCNHPPECQTSATYDSACRSLVIADAAVADRDGDTLTVAWRSDALAVAAVPASTVVVGTPALVPLDAVAVELAPDVPPCGVRAGLTLRVADGRGGLATCPVSVTFDDDVPPDLVGVPGDATVECDAVPPPAPVTAVDACDAVPVVELLERRVDGDCPGRYTLIRTWTATDHCGNLASATQVVIVRDTVAPFVAPTRVDLYTTWPPSHRMATFTMEQFAPVVRDGCSVPVTWRLAGCPSDQPDDAAGGARGADAWGDGATVADCTVATDGTSVSVRVERAGGGATSQVGRRYAVLVTATDACGNQSAPTPIGYIHVAHDQGR
jgi:hypothetical protein